MRVEGKGRKEYKEKKLNPKTKQTGKKKKDPDPNKTPPKLYGQTT